MVAAGFGWSAGDIATAVKLVIKISKAFKASGGAADRYLDALGFLESLKVTLEHLARHADESISGAYGKDIAAQLDRITPHWRAFELYLQQYEQSLGPDSVRHRLAKAPRTVQYTLKELSGEVDRLKASVAQPLQVVNTLLSLQLIFETKLVPQTPLTDEQCDQLVDAICLAGVPIELGQRLDAIEAAQQAAKRYTQPGHAKCIDCRTWTDAPAGQQKSDSKSVHPPEAKAADDCRLSSLSLTCSTSDRYAADSESGVSPGELRLLVEDQHWSVIQLLRALSVQLEELKLSTRSMDFRFCDTHDAVSTRRPPRVSAAVKSTAVTLITAMTASISTGIVVGKTMATASAAPGRMVAACLVDDVASMPSRTLSDKGTQGADSQVSNRMTEKASSHISSSTQQQDVTDTISIAQHLPQPGRAATTDIEKQSLHDSVMEPPSPASTQDGFRYLGVKQEQLVVRLGASHAGQSSQQIDAAVAPTGKSARSSKVPECVPEAKETQPAFFTPGRVFMTIWTPAFDDVVRKSTMVAELPYIDCNLGEKVRSVEMRRFLVLRNEGPYSLCAPIHLNITLNRIRSTSKKPYEIPICMKDDRDNGLLVDLDDFPFHVDPPSSTGVARIPKHSILKLREVCMVDHNVSVVDVGVVTEGELSLLGQLWRDANRDSMHSWLTEDADV